MNNGNETQVNRGWSVTCHVTDQETPHVVEFLRQSPASMLKSGFSIDRSKARRAIHDDDRPAGDQDDSGARPLLIISDQIDLLGREELFSIIEMALNGVTLCRVSHLAAFTAGEESASQDIELVHDLLDVLGRRVRGDRLKRGVDVVLAGLLTVISAPLFLLTALAVRLDSPGPVFFVQERLGQYRRPFRCIKFRTMCDNAERMTGPTWATSDDARTTRIGRFLRRSRLDELPQLINVLRGEMSIVGTRPIRAFFADQLAAEVPFYDLRFIVKPGITGWAQVKYQYSYASTLKQQIGKFHYDYYYVRNRSVALDLYIMLLTGWVMARMKGM